MRYAARVFTEADPGLRRLPEQELVRRGREAVLSKRWADAGDYFFQYCDRLEKQGRPIPPLILANYGLCLGHARRVSEGIEVCRKALRGGHRHPEISLRLSQLYLLAGARKAALDEVERGLAVSPHARELLRLRDDLGHRRPPPIRFLSRGSVLNVGLAKILRRRRGETPAEA